jgi:MerR family transcriptional regulator, thiopeptide resistance regulator
MAVEPDVIPIVPYEDIRVAHEFLVDVLQFTSGGIVETPDGHVVHGEVKVGDRRIWLHEATSGLSTPRRTGVETAGISVFVDDVDAHCAYARERGADIEREPEDQEYGLRDYSVRDPEGHRWFISTPLDT